MKSPIKYMLIGAAALLVTVAQAEEKKSAPAAEKPAQAAPSAVADGKIELVVKGMT